MLLRHEYIASEIHMNKAVKDSSLRLRQIIKLTLLMLMLRGNINVHYVIITQCLKGP